MVKLSKFVGGATLSAEKISAILDVNELLAIRSRFLNSADCATIDARMMAVIKDLSVDDVELSGWFWAIVDDVKLLPTVPLRAVFKKKAEEILQAMQLKK